MIGWIAVSWLGLVASFMFAAANRRPGLPAKEHARGVLAAAALTRSGLRRVLRTVRAAAGSATTGRATARTSC